MCVAQGLLDMLPTTNSAFTTNFTNEDLADSLFYAGVTSGSNCANQAILVDTGSTLRVGVFPVRTAWARSALLWNLIQTADTSGTSYIRTFLGKTDFTALGTDSAIDKSGYQISSNGFVFDFAKMAVRFESVSWKADSQASNDQISRVTNSLSTVLDTMYSNALGELGVLCCTAVMLKQGSIQHSCIYATANGAIKVLDVLLEPAARRSLSVPGHHLSV